MQIEQSVEFFNFFGKLYFEIFESKNIMRKLW